MNIVWLLYPVICILTTFQAKKVLSKTNKIKYIIIILFFLTLLPLRPAHAALWPAIDPIIKQNLEQVYDRIKGMILSTLKQQAVKMLTSQMNKMVSGGGAGGSAKFITNWQDYLVKTPENNTKQYMNDYLSQITKGKGSATGYISASSISGSSSSKVQGASITSLASEGFGKVGGGSYSGQLLDMGKKATVDQQQPQVTFQGDPSQMFAQGNLKQFDTFLSGINNPWSFTSNAQSEYQKKLAEEKKTAQTKAIANQSYIGAGEKKGKGNITMPGINIKDMMSKIQGMGPDILTNATHPEEIITAIASQMISKMSGGLGDVSKMINQQVGKVTGQVTGATNAAVTKSGPGAAYGGSGVAPGSNSSVAPPSMGF